MSFQSTHKVTTAGKGQMASIEYPIHVPKRMFCTVKESRQ